RQGRPARRHPGTAPRGPVGAAPGRAPRPPRAAGRGLRRASGTGSLRPVAGRPPFPAGPAGPVRPAARAGALGSATARAVSGPLCTVLGRFGALGLGALWPDGPLRAATRSIQPAGPLRAAPGPLWSALRWGPARVLLGLGPVWPGGPRLRGAVTWLRSAVTGLRPRWRRRPGTGGGVGTEPAGGGPAGDLPGSLRRPPFPAELHH